MIGQTISHYKILDKLGEGGMGVVYKAEDTKLHRPVALKFLPPELTRDVEAKERFVHEAQAASALDHPNIAVVHEIDETNDGSSFICMAYYEGKTLKEKIETASLEAEQAIDIARQIAEGLQRAHEAKIVHRDLKPANVIVTNRGEVKIVDFGLAKLIGAPTITRTGRTVGTASYMSPEQARGETVDHRTDIWSFGVVLYEMLAGQRPFKSEYEQAVVYSILNESPQPISRLRTGVPSELETIVFKCLEKDAAKRFQTAVELLSDLKRIGRTISSRSVAIQRLGIARTLVSRKLVQSLALLLAGVTVAFLLVLFLPSFRTTVENWLGIAAIPEEKYLAVLPFTNVGDDPTNQAFCDGLFETLTSKLTQLQQFQGALWIVPASEVRERKISSPGQARGALGVTLIVAGSMQRGNDRVRLTLNLVDTRTLRQLRSSVMDDRMANVTSLQDGAAIEVAKMLEVELEPRTIRTLAAGGTNATGAYDFYLQGRGYLQRYEKVENIDIAIGLFQRALREDSLYALAYAALGEAYWRKYDASKDVQWIEQAMKNCESAIELNKILAPAHVTLGLIYRGTGRYEEAVQEFLQALELDPVSADGYGELALAYNALGSLEKAEAAYKKAIELRPGYWAGYNNLGVFYFRQGRHDEAATQFKQVVELTPDNVKGYSNLGGLYFYLERWEDAREMFERSLRIEPNYRAYSNLGTLYFYDGRYGDAARTYENAIQLQDNNYQVRGFLASSYRWSADSGKAQEMFERAAEMAEEQLKVNPRDPVLLSDLAGFYGMLGRRSESIRLLEKALALAPDDVEIMGRAGRIYEQLGNRQRALGWIQKAIERGYSLTELERDPEMKGLRADARFQRLLEGSLGRP